MKPLIALLSVLVASILITRIFYGEFDLVLSGRIAMSVMLLFTAVAHFVFTRGMTMMLPEIFPYKTAMIYLTGVVEIAAAAGLLIPGWRVITGWLLIVFFMLLLPANVYAAQKHVDYQKGTYNGSGLTYLWFRIPLQVLFILWTYWVAIKY